MADGVELAASLYLPDAAGPQPCLLEALPYRKDDLTSSYAESTAAPRPATGTPCAGSTCAGPARRRATPPTSTRASSSADLAEVIEWLAEQAWCDGNVGMCGTSYSGFNSLQIACERPPALKAVCAIYASDDRWTDDVHWRGGALRLLDLVDYCHYMTPMSVLPPVPAVLGRRLARRVAAPARDQRAVAAHLAARAPRRAVLAARVGARCAEGEGYDRIACPVMLVAGWADGYRNNSFRTVERAGRAGVPHRLLAGPVGPRRPGAPRSPGRGSTSTWRWRPGSTAGCVGERRRRAAPTTASTCSSGPRPVPEPDLDLHEGCLGQRRRGRRRGPDARRARSTGREPCAVVPDVGTARGSTAPGTCPRACPVTSARTTPRRSPGTRRRPAAPVVGQPRVRLRLSADAPGRVAVGQALRRVPRRHLGAGRARHARPGLPRRVTTPPAAGPGRGVRRRAAELDACAYLVDPGQRLRLSVAGADWPNTSRRRRRSP